MLIPENTDIAKKDLLRVAVDRLAEHFEPSFSAQVRPYTYVHYEVTLDGMKYAADGFSKVCWPDEWDENTGNYWACRKALRHIAKKFTHNRKKELVGLVNRFEIDKPAAQFSGYIYAKPMIVTDEGTIVQDAGKTTIPELPKKQE